MELWDAYDKDGNKIGFDIARGSGNPVKNILAGTYHDEIVPEQRQHLVVYLSGLAE